MNRAEYYNFIVESLTFLAYQIDVRGRLNLLDKHLHSENFYLHFMNLLFNWNLQNLNIIQQNAPAIDLIDNSNKLVVQVSATATRQKIEAALSKDLSDYKDYTFKFIAISKDTKDLRNKTFSNPHSLKFDPPTDIYDVDSLLKTIMGETIERLRLIYDFLKKELKRDPTSEKVESNLAKIIDLLSKENWDNRKQEIEKTPYDIEDKITYNQLRTARFLIDDHKVHHTRIQKIYSEFDAQGVNKSISILNGIRSMYLDLIKSNSAILADDIFFSIIEKVIQKIRASANYVPIPEEELELCAQILVVDTFIRCKIFENPSGYNYADS